MATLVQRGATWLAGKLQDAAGRSVTVHYRTKSVPVTGTVTLQQYEVVDEQGHSELVESWDWTFTASELVIDGAAVKPIKGWQIRDANDVRYDVMPVGKEPASKYLDSFETMLLVHSKRVSE